MAKPVRGSYAILKNPLSSLYAFGKEDRAYRKGVRTTSGAALTLTIFRKSDMVYHPLVKARPQVAFSLDVDTSGMIHHYNQINCLRCVLSIVHNSCSRIIQQVEFSDPLMHYSDSAL
jgi:hypothetical protein